MKLFIFLKKVKKTSCEISPVISKCYQIIKIFELCASQTRHFYDLNFTHRPPILNFAIW